MRPVRITNLDGAGGYDISRWLVSWGVTAGIRTQLVAAGGYSGAYDLHGRGRAPETQAELELELIVWSDSPESLYDELGALGKAILGPKSTSGLRKVYWRRGGQEYWSYARAAERPQAEHGPGKVIHTKVKARFLLPDPWVYRPLDSSWLSSLGYTPALLDSSLVPEVIAPDLTFARFNVTTTPFSFTLRNEGDTESRRVLFLMVSNGTGGIANPKVENKTTRQFWQLTLTGATAQTRVCVNAAPSLGRAQRSNDGGAVWTDVTNSLSLGTLQGTIMELAVGDNLLELTNSSTPNLTLYVAWWHPYRVV